MNVEMQPQDSINTIHLCAAGEHSIILTAPLYDKESSAAGSPTPGIKLPARLARYIKDYGTENWLDSGKSKFADQSDDIATLYKRTTPQSTISLSKRMLEDTNYGLRKGLCVRLLPSAAYRLKLDASRPLLVELLTWAIEIFQFESHSLVVIELSVVPGQTLPCTVGLIQELVFALTHSMKASSDFFQGRLYLKSDLKLRGDVIAAEGEEGDWAFSLSDMCATLFGRSIKSNRFNHFTALLLNVPFSLRSRRMLACSIANRASLANELGQGDSFFEVENVVFGTSLGGAAVIVDATSSPSFTEHFLSKSFYLKYAQIFFHSIRGHYFVNKMLEYRQGASYLEPEQRRAELSKLLQVVLQYRLRERHSSAGNMAPHRTFHKRLRNALELSTQEEELFADAKEAREFLSHELERDQAEKQKQVARTWRWLSALLAGIAAAVLVTEIGHAIVQMKFSDDLQLLASRAALSKLALEEFRVASSSKHVWEVVVLSASVVTCIVTSFSAWVTQKPISGRHHE